MLLEVSSCAKQVDILFYYEMNSTILFLGKE